MLELGKMGNSMGKELIQIRRELRGRVSGKRGRESSG